MLQLDHADVLPGTNERLRVPFPLMETREWAIFGKRGNKFSPSYRPALSDPAVIVRALAVDPESYAHYASLTKRSPRSASFAILRPQASSDGNPSGCHQCDSHDRHKKQHHVFVVSASRVTQVPTDERGKPEPYGPPESLNAKPRVEKRGRGEGKRAQLFHVV